MRTYLYVVSVSALLTSAAVANDPKKDPVPPPTPNVQAAPATLVLNELGPGTKVTLQGVVQDGYGTSRTYVTPPISTDSHFTVVCSSFYGVGYSVTGDVTVSPGKTTTATVDWYQNKIRFTTQAVRAAPVYYYAPRRFFGGGGGCSTCR
jgi:hypothetical protein